jgi:hypothetical protein
MKQGLYANHGLRSAESSLSKGESDSFRQKPV